MRFPSAETLSLRVPLLWRALLAILILAGALLALVESRARILRSGTEVRLRTAPVDPRDLFRGDYVVLSYDISRLTAGKLAGDKRLKRGETIYVQLATGSDGFAEVSAISRERPPSGTVLAGRVVALPGCRPDAGGIVDCSTPEARIHLSYGVENYFVPQGSGRVIERTAREQIEIVAAVAPSGEAAIKRLLIDGKLVHAEPPY